jgi:hypothetical protein
MANRNETRPVGDIERALSRLVRDTVPPGSTAPPGFSVGLGVTKNRKLAGATKRPPQLPAHRRRASIRR